MRLFLVIILSTLVLESSGNQPEVSKKVKKELEKHYNLEDLTLKEIPELKTNNDLFLNISEGEKELGILVVTSAKGRYDNFDYLIIYNLNFKIELIKVLVYRSEYGSEIMAKRWLSQFYEKDTENLKYGSDIQAISGATFSANSLTENINRINSILREYKGI